MMGRIVAEHSALTHKLSAHHAFRGFGLEIQPQPQTPRYISDDVQAAEPHPKPHTLEGVGCSV